MISHVTMENTQKVWILYGVLLTLNCFIADEQTKAAERCGREEELLN